jgi:uncharacterized protein (TIGR02246 family)
MKRIFVSVCLLILVSTFALGQTTGKGRKSPKAGQASTANSANSTEQEIMKLVNEAKRARMENDKDAYSRLFSDDFYIITTSGKGEERGSKITRNINTVTNGDPLLNYELDEVRIKAYGSNTAVVTARRTLKGKNADGSTRDIPQRILQVWVKQQGRWQMAAGSITPITPEAR